MLQWTHNWGAAVDYHEGNLARGMKVPAEFLDRPEMVPDYVFYWNAFHDLGTERQLGMAAGPIPRSAVRAYALEQGIGGDRFDLFWSIIRELDGAQMKLWAPKDKEDVIPLPRAAEDNPADDKRGRIRLPAPEPAPKTRKRPKVIAR